MSGARRPWSGEGSRRTPRAFDSVSRPWRGSLPAARRPGCRRPGRRSGTRLPSMRLAGCLGYREEGLCDSFLLVDDALSPGGPSVMAPSHPPGRSHGTALDRPGVVFFGLLLLGGHLRQQALWNDRRGVQLHDLVRWHRRGDRARGRDGRNLGPAEGPFPGHHGLISWLSAPLNLAPGRARNGGMAAFKSTRRSRRRSALPR